MSRPECSSCENIARAIRNSSWDPAKNRWSSSLFKGTNVSVSRLAVLPIADLLKIFHDDLDRPPASKVIAAGEINIGTLQQIGKSQNHPTVLTVEEDPLPSNPAHAEIPQKISRGLARKIIDVLILHNEST